ncbi:DEAD/DEAH box helicase [Desulforamulus ferrireducens]|uniref:ATP-dependent RNA helicase CshA n=1 Tax=Desulforamulus ferrireducens TaxID=1833852 RepID=A0A1S6IX11_9FIRM|nr:DEAD/DEAH box helicase [Desulforamulus ferrireducens]AQS59300.1 RNA helicase [Desulforamulus ferrireducens]
MNHVKATKLFGNLELNRRIVDGLVEMGFEEPTPIQQLAVPQVLAGHDVIGQAQTGTGKTAAFSIPLIEKLDFRNRDVQALIITPTRELAIQVAEEIGKIGRFCRIRVIPIYGGQSIDRQIRSLRQGVQVVVGTPGRLLDHLRRHTLKVDRVKMVVLDEADEMLDMGFVEDIEEILRHIPSERQTLLFSATMPEEILRLSRQYMTNPKYVTVSKTNLTVPQIEQVYYEVPEKYKLEALCRLLDVTEISQGIVFCRTKRGVDELVAGLQTRGYTAAALHGDLSQQQRNNVMRKFRSGDAELLVATDVAARGLDIEGVSHVINYDIPQDPEFYVHRIGRTGRAGRSGVAITIINPREYRQLRLIENITKTRIKREQLPSAADVVERQKEGIKERLLNLIQEGKLSYYRSIVDSLIDEYDAMDIAAAALKLSLDLEPERDEMELYNTADFGNTGARPGMVRLFFTLGRKDGTSVTEIIKLVADESGIPSNKIGSINIYENFSFVEVPQDWANCVMSCLHRQQFKGRRLFVEPARARK